jgi:hypothetical protein
MPSSSSINLIRLIEEEKVTYEKKYRESQTVILDYDFKLKNSSREIEKKLRDEIESENETRIKSLKSHHDEEIQSLRNDIRLLKQKYDNLNEDYENLRRSIESSRTEGADK